MSREAPYTEYLERRYEYNAWKTPPGVESQAGLCLPAFCGDELPGWKGDALALDESPDGQNSAMSLRYGSYGLELVQSCRCRLWQRVDTERDHL